MKVLDLKQGLTPHPSVFDALPVHVAAFCALMVRDERARLAELVQAGLALDEQQRHYDVAASLGYALASGERAEALVEGFRADAARHGGRKFFAPGRVPRFEVDGIALLGVAAGLATIEAETAETQWLVDLLGQSETAVADDEWQLSLIRAATAVLTDRDWSKIPSIVLKVAALFSMGFDVLEEDRQSAWSEIARLDSGDDEIARLCAKRAVFDCAASALAAMPVHGATVAELIKLLEGVGRSMSRWTYEVKQRVRSREQRKWHIDHEYHVQSLLWAVLAPIFPDLIDEEHLPSIGHKTPRYDLGIPSLRTIVEVKFMRDTGQSACAKIIDEVAADVSLYLLTGRGFDRIIAFIWDDCQQTEEYSKLIGGLESIEGLERAIILPRPARMGERA